MKSKLFPILIICLAAIISFSCTENQESPLEASYAENTNDNMLQKVVKKEFAGIPFSSRSWLINNDLNGYACIYFYVQDPSIIADDFNLISFWDWSLPGSDIEWAVDGYEFYEEGAFLPNKTRYKGKGAVPIWFIPSEIGKEIFDGGEGSLTMPQLEALNPIKGYATDFKESLKLSPPYNINTINTKASGYLEDGRKFKMNFVWKFDYENPDIFNGILKFK